MTSRGKKLLRILVVTFVALAFLWGVATGALYLVMRRPPEEFGAVMKHVPMVAYFLLPFEPLWMSARAGDLQVGDPAPDFSLTLLNDGRLVRLSQQYVQKPVVLVFGSYT